MSTKSYAQDVVYEHKMLFMSTDEHKMMHTDVVYKHKMLFMNTRCYL